MLISSNCFISTADAYGCRIAVNSDTALAKPNNQKQQGYSTYSCTPSSSSTQYEVHVLAVYEVINRRPPTAGNANVNIVSRGQSNRPIVLVLASYEPVNWILNLPAGISISKVILVSTFAHYELKEKKSFHSETSRYSVFFYQQHVNCGVSFLKIFCYYIFRIKPRNNYLVFQTRKEMLVRESCVLFVGFLLFG